MPEAKEPEELWEAGAFVSKEREELPEASVFVSQELREWKFVKEVKTRDWLTKFFVGLFAFCVIATWVLIFFKNFGIGSLPDDFMKWLGGLALLEVAPIVADVVRAWFRRE